MMQLACHLTADDFQKYYANIPKPSKFSRLIRVLAWVLVFFCVSGTLQLLEAQHVFSSFDRTHSWLLLLSALLIIISAIMCAVWVRRGGMTKWCEQMSGDYRWELNAAGISITSGEKSNFYSWARVISASETEDAWLLNVKSTMAIFIPKRAKAANDEHCFLTEASQYWSAHPDNYGLKLQSELLLGIKQKSFWRDLYHNLKLGVKLAFLQNVKALDFKVRISQIFGLVIVDLLIYVAFDYYQYFPNAMFNLYGLTEYAAASLLFLVMALVISHKAVNWEWLPRLIIMLLASVVVVTSIYLIVDTVLLSQAWHSKNSKLAWLIWGLEIAWVLLAVARCVRLLYGFPNYLTIHFVAIYSFITLVVPGVLTNQQFFIEDYRKESYETEKQVDEEAVYYQQPEFISNMLSQLKPERKDVLDLYFIGFAGSAYQNVFSNEVKFAQHLFDLQFNTAGRSALLINNQDSVNKIPLANTHNLASMLDGIGKLMNVDEDILFLFLSSHGSNKFEISTSFYPFDMNDIPATKVKEMLDHSGIKNRIIVVSACYSGGFIDVLKNENTLILTAARKDRSSFGCSNEAEYTYFGDAYFVQALKSERSFIKAFTEAQKIISTKEKKEQADSLPSLPQIFVGAAIKPKLDKLQTKLTNKL